MQHGDRNSAGGKANPQMSTEFPQLCKWNGFTIDSPMAGWEYGGEAMGKFLPLGREQGELRG